MIRICNVKKLVVTFLLILCTVLVIMPIKALALEVKTTAKDKLIVDFMIDHNANEDNDLLLAGEDVKYEGKVDGNIYSFSNNANINVEKIRNIYGASRKNISLKVDNARGIYLAADNISLDANSQGCYLIGKRVYLSGNIDGDVYVVGSIIELSKDLKVSGNLNIKSPVKPTYPDNVEGSINFIQTESNKDHSIKSKLSNALHISGVILLLLPTVVVTAIIYIKLLGSFKGFAGYSLRRYPIKIFTYGLIMMIGLPTISALLIVAIIGLPTALIILMVYLTCFLSAIPCFGVAIGQLLLNRHSPYISGIVGTSILTCLVAIPYLGIVIFIISLIYTYGLIWLLMIKAAEKKKLMYQDVNMKDINIISRD